MFYIYIYFKKTRKEKIHCEFLFVFQEDKGEPNIAQERIQSKSTLWPGPEIIKSFSCSTDILNAHTDKNIKQFGNF